MVNMGTQDGLQNESPVSTQDNLPSTNDKLTGLRLMAFIRQRHI